MIFCKWQLGVRLAIYKSAAELTVRLTPHRHPLAALAGAEAKRTPPTKQSGKRKSKAATARAFAANPLGESPAYSVAPCLDFHHYAGRYCISGAARFSLRRS